MKFLFHPWVTIFFGVTCIGLVIKFLICFLLIDGILNFPLSHLILQKKRNAWIGNSRSKYAFFVVVFFMFTPILREGLCKNLGFTIIYLYLKGGWCHFLKFLMYIVVMAVTIMTFPINYNGFFKTHNHKDIYSRGTSKHDFSTSY